MLVTGASGFLGVHLCRALAGMGAAVHGVSRSSPPVPVANVEWHLGDLTREDEADKVIENSRPYLVFHLASHVDGRRTLDQVLPTLRGSLLSTVHLLSSLVNRGVGRVVLAGSMEEPDEGEAVPTPVSPYAAAKWAATGYGRMFGALYGVPVALARIFMVYGPGQWDQNKLVPYVIRALLSGESPRIGSGTRPVDWVYVDDVIRGLITMGIGGGPSGVPLDLGSGVLTTVGSVVEEIESIVAGPAAPFFGALEERPFERVRRADVENTRRVLGWCPQVGLRDGLERTVAWFRSRINEQAGGDE